MTECIQHVLDWKTICSIRPLRWPVLSCTVLVLLGRRCGG
jgi:hypothetical protein